MIVRTSSLSMGVRDMICLLTVHMAPLTVMYPSIRCSIGSMLLISGPGLPVEMNILKPLSLASVRAFTVDSGTEWVLKLTKVPSMSKNSAFIIARSNFQTGCEYTQKPGAMQVYLQMPGATALSGPSGSGTEPAVQVDCLSENKKAGDYSGFSKIWLLVRLVISCCFHVRMSLRIRIIVR